MKFGGVFWGSVNPLSEQTKNMLNGKAWLAACIGVCLAILSAQPASAATERRLAFYMVHTKENIDIVYKRNGKYIKLGCNGQIGMSLMKCPNWNASSGYPGLECP